MARKKKTGTRKSKKSNKQMRRVLSTSPFEKLVSLAEDIHAKKSFKFPPLALRSLLKALKDNPNLAPDFDKKLTEPRAIMLKWLEKIEAGFGKRISKRSSKFPSTTPDPIVSKIINGRLAKLTPMDLQKINDAHRISMSAENILGHFLEEFLFEKLKNFGWHCAWGECIRSVDFVNETGKMLQIKNRSNSENSSSSSVRKGTDIKKWFRIHANSGVSNWPALNEIIGSSCKLSEESFENYVVHILSSNPEALAVETNNSWLT